MALLLGWSVSLAQSVPVMAGTGDLSVRPFLQASDESDQAPGITELAIVGFSPQDDTYGLDDEILVVAYFDHHVYASGSPQLALNIGGETRLATFVHYWGGRDLVFRYVVQREDKDDDGISIEAGELKLNGGSIYLAGDTSVNARLDHPGLPADPSKKVNGSLLQPPNITWFWLGGSSGETNIEGDSIRVDVRFRKPVTVGGSPQLALNIGGTIRWANYMGGTNSTYLRFEYVVQPGDKDDDGVSIDAGELRLNGGSIRDRQNPSVDARLDHPGLPPDPSVKVDGDLAPEPPKVSGLGFGGSRPEDGIYAYGDVIEVDVTFNHAVRVTGDSYLQLMIGDEIREAKLPYDSSQGRWISFQYTVQVDDMDHDGVSIPANALKLGSGVISLSEEPSVHLTQDDLTHDAVADDPDRKVDGSLVVVPKVSQIWFGAPPANGDAYELAESISIRVIFDRPIAVTGRPTLALNIGSETRRAIFSFASRGRPWVFFDYVVQPDDLDPDGVSIAADAIDLNGGAITLAGSDVVAADLAIPDPIINDASRKVDGAKASPPRTTYTYLGSAPADGAAFTLGEVIQVQLSFDRPIAVIGKPTILLDIGGNEREAELVEPFEPSANLRALIFSYVVQAEDMDEDGLSVPGGEIRLNEGSIVHALRPDLQAEVTFAGTPATPWAKVNGDRKAQPEVLWAYIGNAPARGDTYLHGEQVEFVIGFDRTVAVDGAPQLVLNLDSDVRYADFVAVDRNRAAFRYVVQRGDRASQGISLDADPLVLNGGSITLAADSSLDADLSYDPPVEYLPYKIDGGPDMAPSFEGIEFADLDYMVGTDIEPLQLPAAVGGDAPLSYEFSPAVPDGLELDAETRTLSGAPSTEMEETQFTWIARDSDGDEARFALTISIKPDRLPGFGEASVEDQIWNVGVPVMLLLPEATDGDGILTYSLTPEVPPGLHFDETERIIEGTPESVTEMTAYRYLATDEDGDVAALAFQITVDPILPPTVSGTLPDLELTAGGQAAMVDASAVFNGLELKYVATSNDPMVSVAEVSGAQVAVTPNREGTATVQVTASNVGGSASVAFAVDVSTSREESQALQDAFSGQARAMLNSVTEVIGDRFQAPVAVSGQETGQSLLQALAGLAGTGGMNCGAASPFDDCFGLADGERGFAGHGSPPFGSRQTNGPFGGSHRGAYTAGNLLWNRSYSVSLNDAGGDSSQTGGRAGQWTLWVAGDVQQFDAAREISRFEGDLQSGYLGADARFNDRWLAGAAVSRSRGESRYDTTRDGLEISGELETGMTAIYPYVQGRMENGLEFWAVAGAGRGDVANDRSHVSGPADEADLASTLGSFGLRRTIAARGLVEVSALGDLGYASLKTSNGNGSLDGVSSEISRARIGVEGATNSDGAVSAFLRLSGRADGGDGIHGAGVEVAAGLRFHRGRVDGELKGRWMTGGQNSEDYEESGVSARLNINARTDGTGVSLSLSPSWGVGETGFGPLALWGDERMGMMMRGDHGFSQALTLNFDGRLDYGLRRGNRLVKPFTEYRMIGESSRHLRLGLALDSAVGVELALGRRESAHRTPDRSIELRFSRSHQ